MAGFWDKMSNFFFKTEEEDDTDSMKDEIEATSFSTTNNEVNAVWKEQEQRKPKKTNLISVPTRVSGRGESGNLEMVLVKATSYDDMQEIARHIKDRKVAVVNFEEMDKDIAQRMVDFLSGATFALDGVPRKVSGGTFIFSSSNVEMSGEIMDREDVGSDEQGELYHNPWLRSK